MEKQKANELESRRKTEKKSEAWEIFNEIIDKSNLKVVSNFVMCSQCCRFQEYNGETTSNLIRHKCVERQRTLDSFINKKTKIIQEDLNKVKGACVKFIAKDLRPYNAMEGDGLFDLLKCMINIGKIYPMISESEMNNLIPCRNTVKSEVVNFANDMKTKIKNYFQQALKYPGGFSSTTDLWSDDFKNNSYICVTAHINLFENNEIKSKRFIIYLNKFDAAAKTGILLEKEIIKIFADFEISEEVLRNQVIFVTDRGPNIRVALNSFQRIYCFAHIVNNIVEDMCKQADAKKLISDAASLVKFMKSSNLNHRCKPSLKSYTKTRWNTVYEMLNSIFSNYSNIVEILNEKEKLTNDSYVGKVTILAKFQIKNLIDFLKLFKDITDDIEGEKYVTLHYVVPSFMRIQKELTYLESDSHIVEEMKERGRNFINAREEILPTMTHKVAFFLHPLFKSLRSFSINEKIKVYTHVKTLMENDIENQDRLLVETHTEINISDQSNSSVTIDTNLSNYLDEHIDEQEDVSIDLNEFNRYVDFKIQKVSKFYCFEIYRKYIIKNQFYVSG